MKTTFLSTLILITAISLTGCTMLNIMGHILDIMPYSHKGTPLMVFDLGTNIHIIAFDNGESKIFWNPNRWRIPLKESIKIYYDDLEDHELNNVDLPLEGRWMIDGKIVGIEKI